MENQRRKKHFKFFPCINMRAPQKPLLAAKKLSKNGFKSPYIKVHAPRKHGMHEKNKLIRASVAIIF
jgi:hypothetical protein